MTAMDDSGPFGSIAFCSDEPDGVAQLGEPVSVLESPFVSGQVDTDALFHQLPATVRDVAKQVEDRLRLAAAGGCSTAGSEKNGALPEHSSAAHGGGASAAAASGSGAPQRAATASVADILESPFASSDVSDVMRHISQAEESAAGEAGPSANASA